MMATVHSYIVLKQTKQFIRGSLVRLDSSGHYRQHLHYLPPPPPPQGTPTLSAQDVAPLTEEECILLDCMVSAAAYTVFSTPGLLTWGVGLKVGDTVLARLPDKSGRGHSAGAQQDQYATAIIRWIGRPTRLSKCQFGVEIVVSTILHCHTCTIN